jgi:hypothetical protein
MQNPVPQLQLPKPPGQLAFPPSSVLVGAARDFFAPGAIDSGAVVNLVPLVPLSLVPLTPLRNWMRIIQKMKKALLAVTF